MKYVLVRMEESGNLFVLDRSRWEEFSQRGFYFNEYKAEVVAEADTTLPLMRLKSLTVEEV